MDIVRLLSSSLLFLLLAATARAQEGDQQDVSPAPTTDFSIEPSDADDAQWVVATAADGADNSTSNATESTGVSSLDGASGKITTPSSLNVTTEASNVTTSSSLNVTTTSAGVTSSDNSTSPTTTTNNSTNTSTAASGASNSTGSDTPSGNNNTASHVYTSMGVVVAALVVAVF